MRTDFLTSQLALLGPFDFIRIWMPSGDEDDQFHLVFEVVRDEDGATYSCVVQPRFADGREAELAAVGFDGPSARLRAAAPSESADRLAALLGMVAGESTKLSLTHGSKRAEVLSRRRVEAVVARINEVIGGRAEPGAWRHDQKVPVQFNMGSVALTLWPKDVPPDVLLGVWALVALALPETSDVQSFMAKCNEDFTWGRLLRQNDHLWYRETIHAAPLSEQALMLSVNVAASTAQRFGPSFAERGAIDATATQQTPPGVPERPPDQNITRATGGYL